MVLDIPFTGKEIPLDPIPDDPVGRVIKDNWDFSIALASEIGVILPVDLYKYVMKHSEAEGRNEIVEALRDISSGWDPHDKYGKPNRQLARSAAQLLTATAKMTEHIRRERDLLQVKERHPALIALLGREEGMSVEVFYDLLIELLTKRDRKHVIELFNKAEEEAEAGAEPRPAIDGVKSAFAEVKKPAVQALPQRKIFPRIPATKPPAITPPSYDGDVIPL